MRQVAGIAPLFTAIAALIVWAGHFMLVYFVQATLCWRGLERGTVLGLPAVPALVVSATALALAATLLIAARAWRRLHAGMSSRDSEEQPQFTAWMSLAIALLAALAMVWETIPALFLPPC